ncbi:hypothetical protein M407DRAFT_17190 [Tulasnella calospora MUT 4182]|uniref:Methyltransferase domain-containing protein n=1 Tax=Tulasnella calospora MUT 4182 TaxID=1051891 RepID=A0A0C3MJP3_9AGAM|nr:hypothetical protein M407DRAFT_17190 [Tulasnella calospora MUT 4182]
MSQPPMDEDVSIADDLSDSGSDMDLGSSVAGAEGAAIHLDDAVSTIYPDDSISMRDFKTVQKKRRPAPSVASDAPSLVSFHSSADGHLFKMLHGRAFNNQSDLYMLPADDHEHSRLDIQHLVLRLYLGSLYASKHLVEAALRPNPDVRPAVLDVGTGSGRWALDMAMQFPHAEVIGLDIVPPVLLTDADVPDNCRFEVDDANLSFAHYENAFNVVHMRSANQGINDFESWLYETARTLRPNGVLLLVNGYPQLYDAQFQPLPTREPGEEGFTWVQFLWSSVYKAMHNRGNFATDSSLHWQRWLESNPNYRDPKTRSMYIPLGPWKQNMSEREQYVSSLMRENCIRILGNFKPILLSDGKKEADVDQWLANVTKELHDLSVHSYTRWQYTVAVRNVLPWQERLEEPQSMDAGSGTMLGPASDIASAPSGIAEILSAKV